MSTATHVKEGKAIISIAKKKSNPKPGGGQVIFSGKLY